jgi:hypothetical protein
MKMDVNVPLQAMTGPSEKPTVDNVQSTGKFWRQPEILIYDMRTHVTHLLRLLH